MLTKMNILWIGIQKSETIKICTTGDSTAAVTETTRPTTTKFVYVCVRE